MRVTRSGETRGLQTLEHVLGADPAVVRGFARAAADRLADGPLTLDARDRLLGRGERLGLRRFDANLVLAAVEQRQRTTAFRTPVARPLMIDGTTAGGGSPVTRSRRGAAWSAAIAAVALQGVILTGAWWLLA